MARMSGLCPSKAVNDITPFKEVVQRSPVPVEKRTMISPGHDRVPCATGRFFYIETIFRAYWVRHFPKDCRVFGSISKEVDHLDRTIAPRSGKADASTDCRVVSGRVGSARVEQNESYPW